MRLQIEVSQIRQEIEKRIHEKEEEFENTRLEFSILGNELLLLRKDACFAGRIINER